MQTQSGLVPSPLDCWLVRRGLYTLGCRMREHCASALALAQHLDGHAAVERVHYPGLPSDPGHDVAARQMRAFGGMLSFTVAGGRERAFEICSQLRIVRTATSLAAPRV